MCNALRQLLKSDPEFFEELTKSYDNGSTADQDLLAHEEPFTTDDDVNPGLRSHLVM